jgi:hypothetical protein
VGRTGSGARSTAGFGINGVEISGRGTRVLVEIFIAIC